MKIKEKILLIEDERTIRGFMQAILTANGYDVLMAGTGAMANTMISSHCPDLIILDLGLPDMDGMTILRSVREWSKVPILVVSARSHERDKVEALDAGADDYLTKPFQPAELMARLRALTRRRGELVVDEQTAGDLKLGLSTSELSCNGKTVTLSYKEFELMRLFMSNLAQTLPKETLIARVWGVDSDADDNNVEAYISFLRKKLKYLGSSAQIVTQRKVGYRLEAPAGE